MISSMFRCLLTLLCCFATALPATAQQDYALKPEQEARFKQYLPRTYAKLAARAPVHVVSLGDSVMAMYGYGPEGGDTLKAYQGVFVGQLADQFFYPGGVRIIRPGAGKPEKANPITGQEITLQNLSRPGKLMLHAMQSLSALAFENKPDLVLVSFGINDAILSCDLSVYRRSVQEVIDFTKKQGSDLILFSPTMVVGDPPEQTLAMTRPYADVMKEVAAANGVFYADLGDLAWLVKIDQRDAALTPPRKSKKSEESIEPVAPVAPSPVKNPSTDQFDPDPEKKAARYFNQVVQDYRRRFNHGTVEDWIHPDVAFHRVLGRRAFNELLDGQKTLPWLISGATATLEGTSKCLLSYRLENTSDKEQTFAVLPLITAAWRPQAAPAEVILKPGKKTLVNITYLKAPTSNEVTFRSDSTLPATEPMLRMPVLQIVGEEARIEDVRAVIRPLSVTWKIGATFNLQDSLTLSGSIINTTEKPLSGKWEASCLGQTWTGKFDAPVKGSAPISFDLKLPAGDSPLLRQKGALGLIITSPEGTLRFDREVEMIRNLGLKETIGLLPATGYLRDKTPAITVPGPSAPGIAFRADADADALYLTWDIYGMNLRDNPDGSGAFSIETNVDARSFGKRLLPGATDVIRCSGLSADGDGTMNNLQPWVFGTGYAMAYDAKSVKSKLTSRPDGARRFTLTLPRNYLYLHEWAMGNGNSQLGINTTVHIWQQDGADEKSPKGAYQPYSLTANGLHRDDAESLGVLELTDKPTRRWTVRLY
jgi:hypothetical protein